MAQSSHPHVHGHHGGHGHVHATAAAVPGLSLLRASLVQRIGLALGPVCVVWALVYWAVR